MKLQPIFTILTLTTALHLQAQIQIDTPTIAGTGCPAGSASVGVMDQEVRVTFDSFSVSTISSKKRLDRKACNLVLPIRVAPGYQVAFEDEITGFAEIKRRGRASFSEEMFRPGTRGEVSKKTWNFPQIDQFTHQGSGVLTSDGLNWTECSDGEPFFLRVSYVLLAQKPSFVNIDEARIRIAGWRRCHAQ